MKVNRYNEHIASAARAIAGAEAMLICAGAGMGVDSGLPDFRGNEGFWNAYPPYRHLKISFVEMANPTWFDSDPSFAWGFYGHRRNLYRNTTPHKGFSILLRWGEEKQKKYFVFTSNVDNQFQKAGFDCERIVECHGSIEWNQCKAQCGTRIFAAGPERIDIDHATMRARDPLPSCPQCNSLARPNILMFGDFEWDSNRKRMQYSRLTQWLREIEGLNLVVVECGAGLAIPTVRSFGESLVWENKRTVLIRINPREPSVPKGHISIPIPSIEALTTIDNLIGTASS